jgi:hypothetical protein
MSTRAEGVDDGGRGALFGASLHRGAAETSGAMLMSIIISEKPAVRNEIIQHDLVI